MNVAIGEYEDPSARDAAVYSTGHLQDLVGAEVEPGEDVLAALDDVAEASVVDDHSVEALNVESALPRRRHCEEIRFLLFAFEKWADYSDRLATVIERAVDPGKTFSHRFRRVFDSRPGGEEHPDSALFLHHRLQEPVVEKCPRIFPHDLHVSRFRGIERRRLQHRRGIEVTRVERWIHGRGQPDEPAPHSLTESQTQLQLR